MIEERIRAPAFTVLVFIPLVGLIGILKKNKEVLLASALISLGLALLAIMSVGGLFITSSLALIVSSFIYSMNTEKVEVAEKVKRAAQLATFASLIAGMGIAVSESSWLYRAISAPLLFFELVILYSLLVILPIVGLAGIRWGKKDVLSTSAAISAVIAIFFVLILQKLLFLIYLIMLILSVFIYRNGIARQIKKETVDMRLKKIALFLASISLFVALIITLYSEHVLVINGCYTYQTTPTSGGRICSDFRPDYVIPVILSTVGIAGIFRENKTVVYASAAVSFVRMVLYLSPIGTLFSPSLILLIFSAFVYQKGVRRLEIPEEAVENSKQYFILLLLFAFIAIWIMAVYIFVHPSNVMGGSGYAYSPAPTK